MKLTLHVTIDNIPDDYASDDQYVNTREYICSLLQELAEGLEARVSHLEIK
jgi:hypothetical protein